MRLITIDVKDESMVVVEGVLKGSRREWTVTGQLDIFVKGKINGVKWDQAGNLALNVCCEMHIPAISLKRVWRAGSVDPRKIDPSQKALF